MEYQNAPAGTTMGFVDAIKVCFRKYADFNGRASRAEYWWFFLLNLIFGWLCNIPYGQILNGTATTASYFLLCVGGLISLAMIVPFLAVSWRRMHDIGKGGGWWFINFVPIIGWIWFFILAATKGEPAANRFGDAPLC